MFLLSGSVDFLFIKFFLFKLQSAAADGSVSFTALTALTADNSPNPEHGILFGKSCFIVIVSPIRCDSCKLASYVRVGF